MRTRLLLAAALVLPVLFGGAAHADLRDTCFEVVPTFRLSGTVCRNVPSG